MTYIRSDPPEDFGLYSFAQRFNRQGKKLWGPGGVSVFPNHFNTAFTCRSDGRGGAFVSMSDDFEVRCQQITAKGEIPWGPNGVSVAWGSPFQHTMDADTSGVVLLWFNIAAYNYKGLMAQRLDLNGNPQWASRGIPVTELTGGLAIVGIVSDEAGGAIVTYKDNTGTHAKRLGASGELLWSLTFPIGLNISSREIQTLPDSFGGIILLWRLENHAIAQRISQNGLKLWGEEPISLFETPVYYYGVRAQPDGHGGVVVSNYGYTAPSSVPQNQRYLGQAVRPDGTLVFGAGGIELSRSGDGLPFCTPLGRPAFLYRQNEAPHRFAVSLFSHDGELLDTAKLSSKPNPGRLEAWFSDTLGNSTFLREPTPRKADRDLYMNTVRIKD